MLSKHVIELDGKLYKVFADGKKQAMKFAKQIQAKEKELTK